jgi:hypothetical protein
MKEDDKDMAMHRKDKTYEDISKRSRTGRLERELQVVELSATRCSYVTIL